MINEVCTICMYFYFYLFSLVFDLHPCIHIHFDLCPSSAHKLSMVSVFGHLLFSCYLVSVLFSAVFFC